MKTCAACRFCVTGYDPKAGPNHRCHGAPPVMVITGDGTALTTFFPIVAPNNPSFWCAMFERRGWLAACVRFLIGR